MKKKKRVIRRRPGVKRNMYFTADTQASIVQYQDSTCEKEKHKIYEKEILPALDKLAENLIFIYGFMTPGQPVENLKNDCVTFLYETLYKFDEARGTKAFSYFNVVAKNWLIINSRRNQKNNRRHVSISDPNSLSAAEKMDLANYDVAPSPDDVLIKDNLRTEIMSVLEEIKKRVTGENESACIDAVITIFSTIDQLDFLNKRAIFVYVRDISGLNPKQLSVSMSIIRKHYRELVGPDRKFNLF